VTEPNRPELALDVLHSYSIGITRKRMTRRRAAQVYAYICALEHRVNHPEHEAVTWQRYYQELYP
jgi:hypothetical protein